MKIHDVTPVFSTIRPWVLSLLVLATSAAAALAQNISIPDPGFEAAIRGALNKTNGPLTGQDMLTLTNLDADRRNITNIAGLETAINLVSLQLQINRLTNFALPNQLTKLKVLDLSSNPLTNCFLPNGLTNLASLNIDNAVLTSLALPATLTGLTNLDLENNQLASINLPSNLATLVHLDLGFNVFTNFSLAAGFTNLSTFYFAGNPLTNAIFPPGMSGMTELNLSQNLLATFTLPAGMTNLDELDLSFNQLTNLSLPGDLGNLSDLDLDVNRFTALDFPSNLANLEFLHLRANLFTNFTLPAGFNGLSLLDVSDGPLRAISLPTDLNHLSFLRIRGNTNLTSLTLPVGLTNLTALNLTANRLTSVVLPSDLNHLQSLDLGGNQLTSLTLPAGLANLTGLFFTGNLVTNLTLPPDMLHLVTLGFLDNPLNTLVLPDPLAASSNLIVNFLTLTNLQSQGISVFAYPLATQLVRPRPLEGAFQFGITGPPGFYIIYGSADLVTWSVVDTVANPLGRINFTDEATGLAPRKFYRTQFQTPPPNMVFIPRGAFNLGTPASELFRQPDESPQTTVTLSRGFWMGKYEVTQGEYLAVIGSNPSGFPGDLSRPVESVSWLDATNYCAKLTQRELAAGHIPPGSQYRLPTEAEWEYAARAGTTTRYYYGDDPSLTNLADYAWFAADSGFGTHPVGQKAPNPWGLYDMEGNVLEWCQDWYGSYPGGAETDPQGPASNPQGVKVIRGGAWDSFGSDCRSGRRQTEGVSPFITDFILGFRVVLVTGP